MVGRDISATASHFSDVQSDCLHCRLVQEVRRKAVERNLGEVHIVSGFPERAGSHQVEGSNSVGHSTEAAGNTAVLLYLSHRETFRRSGMLYLELQEELATVVSV